MKKVSPNRNWTTIDPIPGKPSGRCRAGALLIFFLTFFLVGDLAAQSLQRSEQRGARFEHLDEEGAETFLQTFREHTLQSGTIFDFTLRVMPRRGAETRYRGRFWTSPLDSGRSGSLIELAHRDGTPLLRLLFENGPDAPASIWRSDYAADSDGPGTFGEPRKLTGEELFVPIASSDYTPFDLQMPFLFWPDTTYEGRYFLRGRSTYTFTTVPPVNGHAGLPVEQLRLHFDAEFAALMQVDWLDARGRENKSLALLEIKEVADQWLPKTLDLRNQETRGKTRFIIEEAALDLLLPDLLFQPSALTGPLPEVDPDLFHRVN